MRRHILFLILLILAGAFLRFYGIQFGLPYLYHPDEPVAVHETLRMAAGGLRSDYTFHPHFFNYLLLFVYGAYYGIERVLGHLYTIEDFKALFINDPTPFYLLGRVFSASLGVATIPLLYKTGEKIYGKTEGLLAAFFLTFSFLHISNAHYLKLTMAETFFVILTFFFMIKVIQKGRWRDALSAGFFGGIALATNYNAGLIIPFVFLAQILRRDRAGLPFHQRIFEKKIFVSFLTVILGFCMTSPLLLFNVGSFFKTFQRMTGFFGHSSAIGTVPLSAGVNPLAYYVFSSLRYGIGIPLELLALAGILYVFFRAAKARRAEEICLVSFTLFYIFIFSRLKFSAHRYIVPALPFLLLSAAAFLASVVRIRPEGKKRTTLLWSAAALFVVFPARDACYHDWLITHKEDTRAQAGEWIEKNVPPGTGIAMENYVRVPAFEPPLLETAEESTYKLEKTLDAFKDRGKYRRLSLEKGISKRPRYRIIDLIEAPHLAPDYENYYDLQELAKRDVRYVILNHLYRRPFLDTTREKEKRKRFEEELKQHARLVKRFVPLKEGKAYRFINHESAITPFEGVLDFSRPGPELEIYELREI